MVRCGAGVFFYVEICNAIILTFAHFLIHPGFAICLSTDFIHELISQRIIRAFDLELPGHIFKRINIDLPRISYILKVHIIGIC